jgi:hypothetical protein
MAALWRPQSAGASVGFMDSQEEMATAPNSLA